MRLVTRCPACATTFKVVRDQLRISDGWVRCGRCSEVFDATLDLQETDDEGVPLAPPNGAQPPAAAPQSYRPPQESLLPPSGGLPAMSWPAADLLDLGANPAPSPAQTPAPASFDPEDDPVPIPSLDDDDERELQEPWFDDMMSSTQALQAALQAGAAASSEAGALSLAEPQRQEPGFTPALTTPSPIEEAVNAQLQKALRRERIKALRRERAEQKERERAEQAGNEAAPEVQPPIPPLDPALADTVLLEAPSAPVSFVEDVGTEPSVRPSRVRSVLLGLACLLALVLLVFQVARHERDSLVAREPRLRPALQSLCDWTGCELSALRQISSITIEGAAFSREKEGEGYQLAFTLRNGSRTPLAMPSVELTLLDTQERALVRRVLAPAQFGAPAVLGAGAERSTTLPLQLTGSEAAGLPPVAGYKLVAFYP